MSPTSPQWMFYARGYTKRSKSLEGRCVAFKDGPEKNRNPHVGLTFSGSITKIIRCNQIRSGAILNPLVGNGELPQTQVTFPLTCQFSCAVCKHTLHNHAFA